MTSAAPKLPDNFDQELQSPQEIVEWVVAQDKNAIVTTSFGPFSAVMLHLASQIKSDIPVVWVDTGYNTLETYTYAEQLIQDLNLNIQVFTPEMTAARRNALMNGIPAVDSELHTEFTRQVKLEPFQRMLGSVKPDYWLTAIRKDETEFRKSLDVFSDGPGDIVKVAPFLNWTEVDMEGYLYEHDLPQVGKYKDPTKAEENRECGLHTMDYSI
ncbi:MAG: phosphoadenosine phosphosulfate reductase family protein [Gammaproteobacteria bacterium]|nr:phosphoadenosine phosphosulfate reductase family protein [Gammaproteobacteria bacterium]